MSSTVVSDAFTSALQAWSQGNQQAALEAVRPHADAGDRAAVLLIAWFMSQMGQAFWTDGLAYARKAAELGMPQPATYFFGQILGDPNFRSQAPELARVAVAAGWSFDPLPNAPGAMQQGDPTTAVGLLLAASTPRPTEVAWASQLEKAKGDFEAIAVSASSVARKSETTLMRIAGAEAAVDQQRANVEKRAQSLLDLIDRITSAQATSYFEEEASRYGGEAKWSWRGGLAVIIAAAAVAVTPLMNYYYDRLEGNVSWLKGTDLVAAHTAPAVALGALAGVLLARARSRDRARQRARDLSVALQTMFVYGEQIDSDEERQAFIRDMGRTVLEAFLRHDAPVDSDRSLIAAIRGH